MNLPKFAIILDIETLSVRLNAIVTEAAFVLVNLETGLVIDHFVSHFNKDQPESHYDHSVQIWLDQAVCKSVQEKRVSACEAIADNEVAFLNMVERIKLMLAKIEPDCSYAVYGNGSNFDQPILASLGQRLLDLNNVFPWHFRNELCLRTLTTLCYTKEELKKEQIEIRTYLEEKLNRNIELHTGLDDALLEAEMLHRIYTKLKSRAI